MRRDSWLLRGALLAAGVLLGPGSLEASLVTFGYDAVVRLVGTDLAGGPFSTGQLASGRFSFDSSAPNEGNATFGRYDYVSFSWELGSYAGASAGHASDALGVYDDVAQGDVFLVQAQMPAAPPVKGLELRNVLWRLIDPSGSVFSSVALPLIPPPVSAFDATNVNLNFLLLEFGPGTGTDTQVRAEITNLYAVAVPEPSTSLVLLLGTVAALRRSRRSAAHSP